MPNPADAFSIVTKTKAPSQNQQAHEAIDHLIKTIEDAQVEDAIITAVDDDNGGLYTVDVYGDGFGEPPTIEDVEAFVVENQIQYVVNSPCRVKVIEDGSSAILRPTQPFFFKITAYTAGKSYTEAKPCLRDGTVDASIPTSKVDLALGTTPIGPPATLDTVVLVMLYDQAKEIPADTLWVVGVILSAAARGHFTVKLESTDGDGTVADPFVYTAKVEETETVLGTNLTPLDRLPVNFTTAATLGTGDYDPDGSFRLIRAFETIDSEEACPE